MVELSKIKLFPILDSAAVSIFVVILVELTNTVFVNSTNISTNIETAVLSKPSRSHQPTCFWKHFLTEPISTAMCLNLTTKQCNRFQPTLLIGAKTFPHGVNATGPTCINLIFLRLCPERKWWNSREATTLFTEQVFKIVLIMLEYHRNQLRIWRCPRPDQVLILCTRTQASQPHLKS